MIDTEDEKKVTRTIDKRSNRFDGLTSYLNEKAGVFTSLSSKIFSNLQILVLLFSCKFYNYLPFAITNRLSRKSANTYQRHICKSLIFFYCFKGHRLF